MITQAELKELLDYDPLTGVFRWKVRPTTNVKIGDVAGTLGLNGYIQIRIKRQNYRAHRLAWLYMTGTDPIEMIDHENKNKQDNRFSNLRECTAKQNPHNITKPKHNTSGYMGVSYCKSRNKWTAQIKVDKKVIYLGRYNTPEEAHQAYCKAKAELHPFSSMPHQ